MLQKWGVSDLGLQPAKAGWRLDKYTTLRTKGLNMDYKDSKYHAPPNTTFMTYKEECEQLRIQVDLIKAQLDEATKAKADYSVALADMTERCQTAENGLAESGKYGAKATAANIALNEKFITLQEQFTECKSEGLEMRKSLIGWRSKSFGGTDQEAVVDRGYPCFAAIAAQKDGS